jgi:hypothetical protein
MKLKVTIAALALATLPSLSFAMCSWSEHKSTTASQCAEGQVYDADSGTCVTATTS